MDFYKIFKCNLPSIRSLSWTSNQNQCKFRSQVPIITHFKNACYLRTFDLKIVLDFLDFWMTEQILWCGSKDHFSDPKVWWLIISRRAWSLVKSLYLELLTERFGGAKYQNFRWSSPPHLQQQNPMQTLSVEFLCHFFWWECCLSDCRQFLHRHIGLLQFWKLAESLNK